MRDPQVFRQEIEALPRGSWVVVDEIQKLPALMNEIHDALSGALTRRLREPLEAAERGALLETLIFHELRGQIAYADCAGELSYYRTPSGTEIDSIWTRASRAVGIEVKASARWRPEFSRALTELYSAGIIGAAWGVYLGDQALQIGPIRILPLRMFLHELVSGHVLTMKKSLRAARTSSRG